MTRTMKRMFEWGDDDCDDGDGGDHPTFIFNEVNKRMFEERVKTGHDSKQAKLGAECHHLRHLDHDHLCHRDIVIKYYH